MQLEVFEPSIASEVAECPIQQIHNAIIGAAIEFCERSEAWNAVLDPITLRDGVAGYELDFPNGARALRAMDVWDAYGQIEMATLERIAAILPDWQVATSTRPNWFNSAIEAGVLTLYPTPADPAGGHQVWVRAAFAPTRDATQLDDVFAQRYFDGICHGAKARLMRMPRRAWTDLPMAAAYQAMFSEAWSNARVDVLHSRSSGVIVAQPRAFGY